MSLRCVKAVVHQLGKRSDILQININTFSFYKIICNISTSLTNEKLFSQVGYHTKKTIVFVTIETAMIQIAMKRQSRFC